MPNKPPSERLLLIINAENFIYRMSEMYAYSMNLITCYTVCCHVRSVILWFYIITEVILDLMCYFIFYFS